MLVYMKTRHTQMPIYLTKRNRYLFLFLNISSLLMSSDLLFLHDFLAREEWFSTSISVHLYSTNLQSPCFSLVLTVSRKRDVNTHRPSHADFRDWKPGTKFLSFCLSYTLLLPFLSLAKTKLLFISSTIVTVTKVFCQESNAHAASIIRYHKWTDSPELCLFSHGRNILSHKECISGGERR